MGCSSLRRVGTFNLIHTHSHSTRGGGLIGSSATGWIGRTGEEEEEAPHSLTASPAAERQTVSDPMNRQTHRDLLEHLTR